MIHTYIYPEVVDAAVSLQERLQPGLNMALVAEAVVLAESPELLEAIELSLVTIAQCLLLEVLIQVWPEVLLQAIAVETEQTLQAIPVACACILQSQPTELLIHLAVEVLTQEE